MIRTAMTEYGAVRGRSAADPRITAFLGIPFAAPPVGDLRWHAPVPPVPWYGVRECLEFAPISMQWTPQANPDSLYDREWHVDPEIPMSEDCLYLNVWTPAKSSDEKLPVYVWFFGGGLQCGYTSEMEFDGERLARRGIVVVTVNYRVNVFGFLAHPEITTEDPDAPANFGHLDQHEGLMWTYRNIAEFGGDPNNITIGGQSAGGMSVMAQLNYPGNKGYIKRAIVDSGIFMHAFSSGGLRTAHFADAEAEGVRLFEHLGVKTLAEARAIHARELFDKFDKFRGRFGTVADGVFQTDSYFANAARGEILDVPMFIGHTNAEFGSSLRVPTKEALDEFAAVNFGHDADKFKELIGADGTLEDIAKNTEMSSIEFAFRYLNKKLRENGFTSPHYYYEFGVDIPGYDNVGAFHSVDLWFWFETIAKCWRPFVGRHYDIARVMCNYWANFIKTGDPNGNDADGTPMPEWHAFTPENNACMGIYSKITEYERQPSELMQFVLEHK